METAQGRQHKHNPSQSGALQNTQGQQVCTQSRPRPAPVAITRQQSAGQHAYCQGRRRPLCCTPLSGQDTAGTTQVQTKTSDPETGRHRYTHSARKEETTHNACMRSCEKDSAGCNLWLEQQCGTTERNKRQYCIAVQAHLLQCRSSVICSGASMKHPHTKQTAVADAKKE